MANTDDNGSFHNIDKATENLNNDTPNSPHNPKGLVSAISQIQRYYLFEKTSTKDIENSYFTLEQMFNYLKIGFFAGFWESLFFVVVMPFLLTIYPSFKEYFLHREYSPTEHYVTIFISYTSIVGITIWLSSLARFYEGTITKKAIFYLILGRAGAFVLKGLIVFFVLSFLYNYSYNYPNEIFLFIFEFKDFIDFFLPVDYTYTPDDLYHYYFNYIIPAYKKVSFDTLFSMLILGLVPFIAISLKGFYHIYQLNKGDLEYAKY